MCSLPDQKTRDYTGFAPGSHPGLRSFQVLHLLDE